MSKDLNQCNFIGRLGQDVETKYLPSGEAVTNFSIACSDDYKDKQGQKCDRTNWVNVVTFGKLAEICRDYLTKGKQVFVSGKFTTDKWNDKTTGEVKYSTKIKAFDVQMLGSKADSQGHSQPQQQQQQPQQPQQPQQQQQGQAFDNSFDDSTIPF